MKKKIGAIPLLLSIIIFSVGLFSCSHSITIVHTQGQATDVVDETQSTTPSTNIEIPDIAIPKL